MFDCVVLIILIIIQDRIFLTLKSPAVKWKKINFNKLKLILHIFFSHELMTREYLWQENIFKYKIYSVKIKLCGESRMGNMDLKRENNVKLLSAKRSLSKNIFNKGECQITMTDFIGYILFIFLLEYSWQTMLYWFNCAT